MDMPSLQKLLDDIKAQIEAGGRAGDKLTVAEFEQLQHDALSVVARTIVRALRDAMQARSIADSRRRAAASISRRSLSASTARVACSAATRSISASRCASCPRSPSA